MSDAVKCPYCGKEMEAGTLDKSAFWMSDTRSEILPKSVSLSSYSYEERAMAYYCKDCRKVIADVPDVEDPFDNLKKKWTAWSEKRKEEYRERAVRREEEKREREREKRRENDPWED